MSTRVREAAQSSWCEEQNDPPPDVAWAKIHKQATSRDLPNSKRISENAGHDGEYKPKTHSPH